MVKVAARRRIFGVGWGRFVVQAGVLENRCGSLDVFGGCEACSKVDIISTESGYSLLNTIYRQSSLRTLCIMYDSVD